MQTTDHHTMTGNDQQLPSQTALAAILNLLAPGSVFVAINKLPGSFSNYTYLLDAQAVDGAPLRFVIRRYAIFGSYDRSEKARREFKTYQLLRRHGIPAPQPLYLDDSGELIGSPGIVSAFVPGVLVQLPSEPMAWARSLAIMLALIHAVPCDPVEQDFLLDANQQASWFIKPGALPQYMQAHPLGPAVWQAVHDHFPLLQKTVPGLVHVDYWPGNVLWDGGRISAVVDWEEAAFGDPAIDVAYCRMNMAIDNMPEAAELFLRIYEEHAGRHLPNLAFWELAAAARPMVDPLDWQIVDPLHRDFLASFITDAMNRLGA